MSMYLINFSEFDLLVNKNLVYDIMASNNTMTERITKQACYINEIALDGLRHLWLRGLSNYIEGIAKYILLPFPNVHST